MALACAAPHSRNLRMVDQVDPVRQEWIWWDARWWAAPDRSLPMPGIREAGDDRSLEI